MDKYAYFIYIRKTCIFLYMYIMAPTYMDEHGKYLYISKKPRTEQKTQKRQKKAKMLKMLKNAKMAFLAVFVFFFAKNPARQHFPNATS